MRAPFRHSGGGQTRRNGRRPGRSGSYAESLFRGGGRCGSRAANPHFAAIDRRARRARSGMACSRAQYVVWRPSLRCWRGAEAERGAPERCSGQGKRGGGRARCSAERAAAGELTQRKGEAIRSEGRALATDYWRPVFTPRARGPSERCTSPRRRSPALARTILMHSCAHPRPAQVGGRGEQARLGRCRLRLWRRRRAEIYPPV